jgi:hypothetical protein
MDVEQGLTDTLSARVAEIESWEPANLRVVRRGRFPARLVVMAMSAAALGAVILLTTRGDDTVGGLALHPPRIPPGATFVPPTATPALGCFGQSIAGQARWFEAREQAVLDSETALPGPGVRNRPGAAVQPPLGRPQRVGAGRFSDGAWTFHLRHEAGRGWTVTELNYCPPRS